MKSTHLPLLLLLLGTTITHGADAPAVQRKENLSVRNEVQTAIDRGLAFLEGQQKPNGSWEEKAELPGITAYPLIAFQYEPKGKYVETQPDFMRQAYAALRQCAKPDGGIYVEECPLANTALCLTALLRSGEPQDDPLIEAARKFIIGAQVRRGAVDMMEGGMSYGDEGDRQLADLHNTVLALEALRDLEAARPATERVGGDLNWQAAIEFVTRCQNLRSHNKNPWASDDPANKGGFIYSPNYSSAGDMEVSGAERRVLRSYSSISYCGLLSLLYGGVTKDDPRVVAALDWLIKNYSLEENHGMKKAGLFLQYHVMAKAFAIAQVEEMKLPDGRAIDWACDLALKLIETQKSDGSWLNSNGRWMENDPILVTSYAVIALEIVYRRL